MGKVLSTEDLKRLMAEAASQGKFKLSLYGEHFSEIDLDQAEVPVSLDLNYSRIDGDVNLRMAKFHGSFISLDGADVSRRIILSGMEVLNPNSQEGIGVFLRGAEIGGGIFLYDTRIHTLCIYGTKFHARRTLDVAGLVHLDRAQINRIFLNPESGELDEIRRMKKGYREAMRTRESFPSEPE